MASNSSWLSGYYKRQDEWMRVLYNGRMLAKETGANLNVVELFAIIHDCQRDNDSYDLNHGRRAAQYVNRNLEKVA